MNPYSFSATSLQVAELCMARYKAEYIDRARNIQGTAANVGIVCHGTFEHFLRGIFIRKDIAGWDKDKFLELFHENYDEVFGPNRTLPEYEDAKSLCIKWFERPNHYEQLQRVTVLSLESKNSYELKTSIGPKPVNYIMDRLERIDEKTYRVVDYKSNRAPLTPRQLRGKLQARLYALVTNIMYPKATSVWVQFDFLRHQPVEIEFTREQNRETFLEIKRAAETIIATKEDGVKETLNLECGWCVRAATCKTLRSNVAAGGILSLDLTQQAALLEKIRTQGKALSGIASDLEFMLINHANQIADLEFETDNHEVEIIAKTKRKPDHEAIAKILGASLALEVATFSVTAVDKLIKEGRVTDAQAEQLKEAMPLEVGEASVKVTAKK